MTDLDDDRAGDPLTGLTPDPRELLQVRHEIVDAAVVVHAAGDMDMATRDLLDQELQAAEHQVAPPAPVVLDLTEVRFLASMGLSLMVDHSERCAQIGTRLIVVATDRAVLRPIQLTGLGGLLTIAPTVQAALTGAS